MKQLQIEEYLIDDLWWANLEGQQLKSKARQRATKMEAGLKELCSTLAQYFENAKTYEEIQSGIDNDLEVNDSKGLQDFLRSYSREGTNDGRNYSTILGSIKKTSILVKAFNYVIDNRTDRELSKYISDLEHSFRNTMLCIAIPQALMAPLAERKSIQQEARRKGGEKRAEPYIAIKNEIARLLQEQRPSTGWKNKAFAAEQLADQIAQFQQKYPEKNRIKHEGIAERIRRWLYEDKDLDVVFQQTKNN